MDLEDFSFLKDQCFSIR